MRRISTERELQPDCPVILPPSKNNPEILAEGLRNFFLARNSAEIRLALEHLGWTKNAGENPQTMEPEYVFNRLFVGPGAVAAPPYSSVYLDTEPMLMGQSSLDIRALMDDLGIGFQNQGSAPDDHIACELDLWLLLRRILLNLEKSNDRNPLHAEIRAALAWLTCDHMFVWLPRFRAKIAEADDLPDYIRHVSFCIGRWQSACTIDNQG